MLGIWSRRKRTRYGTRTVHHASCPVPGCEWAGPGHYKRSLAHADLIKHIAKKHPKEEGTT